jgi:hypothetical protein
VPAAKPESPATQVPSGPAVVEEASATANVEKPKRKPRARAKKATEEPEISNG